MTRTIMILLLLCIALPARTHDFHASLAEVEWNQRARKIEVSLRLFPDDFEKALSLAEGRAIRLEKSNSAAAMERYVGKRFVISTRDHRSTFKVVGTDTKVDSMWLFLESDWTGGPLAEAQVTNSLLTELFSDQVNLVNIKSEQGIRTLTFNAESKGSRDK